MQELGDGLGGAPRRAGLAGGADQPAADDHAIGDPADPRGLRGGADPEADGHRHLRLGLGRGDEIGELRGQLVALTGGPDGRDDVDEAAGDGADPAQAPGRGRRRDQRHQRQPGGGEGLADLLPLAERQVGDDRPGGPGLDRAGGECLGAAVGEDHVGVDHQDDGQPLGDRRADLERGSDVGAALERRRRRRMDGRPVGERVREGNAELDQVGTGVGIGVGHGERCLAIGVAAHHVWHQRRPALVLGRLEGCQHAHLPGQSSDLSHRFSPAPQPGPCRRDRRDRGCRNRRRRRSPAAMRSRARTRVPG